LARVLSRTLRRRLRIEDHRASRMRRLIRTRVLGLHLQERDPFFSVNLALVGQRAVLDGEGLAIAHCQPTTRYLIRG